MPRRKPSTPPAPARRKRWSRRSRSWTNCSPRWARTSKKPKDRQVMKPDLKELGLALEGETDVVFRRDFSHPPARVWRALTEPELIRKWMGSNDSMKRCEMDVRAG